MMGKIDWNKPLELMDGAPVVLDPRIVGNPDRDGDYWIVREDGEKIQSSEPNWQYRTMCVRSNGMEEGTDVQIVRNRAGHAAASVPATPADDETPTLRVNSR